MHTNAGPAQRRYVESVDGCHIAVLVQPADLQDDAGRPHDALPRDNAHRDDAHRDDAQRNDALHRTKVPVLLVHGFGSNAAANWRSTGWFRTLARAGIPAAAVDLRGHGKSDRLHWPQAYRLDVMMADLIGVLRGIPEVFENSPHIDLVGYSLGGRMVVELADALSAASAAPTARKLVVGGYDGRQLLHNVDLAELTRWVREGIGAPEQQVLTAAIAGAERGQRVSPVARLVHIARAVPGNDLDALQALVAGLVRDGRVTERAGTPTVPTLVVAGSDDLLADRAADWAAAMPDGRALIIPGRHHINTVTAAAFRVATVEFLQSR